MPNYILGQRCPFVDLLYALRDVSHRLITQAQAAARNQGLGLPHMFAMRTIAEADGITHGALAQRLHVTPGSLTPTVRRLVDAGFITRTQDADDGRIHHLHISPAGQAFKQTIEATLGELVAQGVTGWTDGERATFQALLERFASNLA